MSIPEPPSNSPTSLLSHGSSTCLPSNIVYFSLDNLLQLLSILLRSFMSKFYSQILPPISPSNLESGTLSPHLNPTSKFTFSVELIIPNCHILICDWNDLLRSLYLSPPSQLFVLFCFCALFFSSLFHYWCCAFTVFIYILIYCCEMSAQKGGYK